MKYMGLKQNRIEEKKGEMQCTGQGEAKVVEKSKMGG
jgi:hypothetical protein